MTTEAFPDHWRERIRKLATRIQGMDAKDAESEIAELVDDCMRETIFTATMQDMELPPDRMEAAEHMLGELIKAGDDRQA